MNVPLINIQDVVDFADLDPNIQQRKFNQYIIMAQDRFLSSVIGVNVGSSMKMSLNSGVSTLTGDNATVIGQQSRVNESNKYILLAERQSEKIFKFLIDNPTLYTCYDDELCKIKNTYIPYFGL